MPATALQCKECQAEYPLEARYVCENCFGPLEVAYDFTGLHADELRRRIQAGPLDIWRYADFLPFEQRPRTALAAGMTPLIRADRLAQKLGLGEVWIKNDAANPTHSFKDRVVTIAVAKARELGYGVVACASTGNLANAVAAGGWCLPPRREPCPARLRRRRRRRACSPTSSPPPISRSRRCSRPAS